MADESAQQPKKWRLRITVRVLMLAILALSVGIALPVSRARRQEAAIAQITQLGGIVGYDYNYWEEREHYPLGPSGDPPAPRWLRLGGLIGGSARPSARSLWPNQDPPAPQWLLKPLGPEFFRRANLVSLAERNRRLRAIPDLAFLEDLPDVRVLHLDSRSFADSELAHARPLKLIRFFAKYSSLGDEGLAHLADQVELWEIDLCVTRVTDRGLAHLARMPKLRLVDLALLKITDAGLAHLSRLTNLEHLNLAGTLIGDGGLVHLRGLGRLKRLNLAATKLSDAALDHLKLMPGLKWIGLPNTGLTDDGIADLRRAIPGLRIDRLWMESRRVNW